MGPDLTHIGKVRTARDLLESIVYPSSNFVRSYEPVTLGLRDGGTYYGILKQASADSVVLVVAPGVDHRFVKSKIAEIHPSPISLMPTGVDKAISTQELADLIAFLQSLQ
jgi:putative heme-binding domain-containing protein